MLDLRIVPLLALLGACASGPSAEELRRDLTVVKKYREAGQPVTAFYLSERLRRAAGAAFDDPFQEVLNGAPRFDPSARGEAALRRAIADEPDDLALRLRLADIFVYRQDWKRAEAEARAALAVAPEDFEVTAFLGRVLLASERRAEAEAMLEAWTRRNPTAPAARLVAIDAMRDAAAKRQAVEAELAARPDDPELLYRMAHVEREAGDLDAAERFMHEAARRALTAEPDPTYILSWAGRFFLKVVPKPIFAVRYYLEAYFSNPHAYETEFVESRIWKLLVFELDGEDAITAADRARSHADIERALAPLDQAMRTPPSVNRRDALSRSIAVRRGDREVVLDSTP